MEFFGQLFEWNSNGINRPPDAPSLSGDSPLENVVELSEFSPPDNFDHGPEFQPRFRGRFHHTCGAVRMRGGSGRPCTRG